MSKFPPMISLARPGTASPEATNTCLSSSPQLAGWSWELPRRLRLNDDQSQPTAEAVREMRANLTGFFVVLREWSATVKARPPPWRLSRGYYYVYFITLKDIYDDK